MLRRFVLVVAVVLFLLPSVVVHADVMVGNDFSMTHSDKLEYPNREQFYVNAPDGYTYLCEEPGSGIISRTLLNGTEVSISKIYKYNGKYWGCMHVQTHGFYEPGWIKMEHLYIVYTGWDFYNENADKIIETSIGSDIIINTSSPVVWEWPGSDKPKTIVDFAGRKNGAMISYVYIDDFGRTWVYGHIMYEDDRYVRPLFYFTGWICLDDPENADIPAFNPAPEPIKWYYNAGPEWPGNDATPNRFPLTAIIVIAFSFIAVIYMIIRKKFRQI